MKPFPTYPMRQHDKFIAALCDDLFDRFVNKTEGTPRADRVAEINRQYRAIAFGTVAGRQSPSLASRLGPDGRPSTIAGEAR